MNTNNHINRVIYMILFMFFTVSAAKAAPTAEEMWQTIQEQQKVIEELQEQLDATAEAVESGAGGATARPVKTLEGTVLPTALIPPASGDVSSAI